MRIRPARISAWLLSTLLLAACAPQPLTVTREPVTLRLVAADDAAPLVTELTSAYEAERPWVTVEVEIFNSSVAEERLRAGAADLALLAQPGVSPPPLWSVPFATTGVVVIAHPAAPVSGLSLLQLQEVFRGRVGEWEDTTPVQVVSREAGAGTRRAFEQTVMDGHHTTMTAVALSDDRQILEYVGATPGSIGYVSMAWLSPTAHVLAVEGVTPTLTALDRYPLAYGLFLAARSEPEGDARGFVEWVLGPEGQRYVARHFAPPQ